MVRPSPLRLLLAAAVLAAAGPTATRPTPPPPAAAGIELRPAPLSGELQLPMRDWHRRYRGLITPVLEAWTELALAARRPSAARPLLTGCRELGGALAALDRQTLLSAPDTAVALHLDETLRSLGRASRSCTRGAYFLTTWRLHQADGAWAELGRRLELYGLAP